MNVPQLFRSLVVVEAIIWLFGALLHTGLLVSVVDEPPIPDAVLVEALCGICLAVCAYALFAARSWAWRVAIAAHSLALAGVLLGMAALNAGLGPRTNLNTALHTSMLLLALTGLALLLVPRTRAMLRQ
jgi:hypothetical protein